MVASKMAGKESSAMLGLSAMFFVAPVSSEHRAAFWTTFDEIAEVLPSEATLESDSL